MKYVADKIKKLSFKYVVPGIAGLAVIAVIAHYLWTASGSNEWVFKEEKNGIKIWTLKKPGNPLLKGKAAFTVESTLGGMIRIVYDETVHEENDMMDVTFMESQRAPGYYSVFNTFRQDMPGPFKKREFVLLSQHSQNPETKVIELNAIAAPNKIPHSDCCVRLVHLHNRYLLKPAGDGKVDVEFYWDIDLGGGMPYVLQNLGLPSALYTAMNDFRNLAKKYQDSRLDYIQEPGEGDTEL